VRGRRVASGTQFSVILGIRGRLAAREEEETRKAGEQVRGKDPAASESKTKKSAAEQGETLGSSETEPKLRHSLIYVKSFKEAHKQSHGSKLVERSRLEI